MHNFERSKKGDILQNTTKLYRYSKARELVMRIDVGMVSTRGVQTVGDRLQEIGGPASNKTRFHLSLYKLYSRDSDCTIGKYHEKEDEGRGGTGCQYVGFFNGDSPLNFADTDVQKFQTPHFFQMDANHLAKSVYYKAKTDNGSFRLKPGQLSIIDPAHDISFMYDETGRQIPPEEFHNYSAHLTKNSLDQPEKLIVGNGYVWGIEFSPERGTLASLNTRVNIQENLAPLEHLMQLMDVDKPILTQTEVEIDAIIVKKYSKSKDKLKQFKVESNPYYTRLIEELKVKNISEMIWEVLRKVNTSLYYAERLVTSYSSEPEHLVAEYIKYAKQQKNYTRKTKSAEPHKTPSRSRSTRTKPKTITPNSTYEIPSAALKKSRKSNP